MVFFLDYDSVTIQENCLVHSNSLSTISQMQWYNRRCISCILGVLVDGTAITMSASSPACVFDDPVKSTANIFFFFAVFSASIMFFDFPEVLMQIRTSFPFPSASTCLLNV